ncbi:MAG: UDP-N-acetylmuramoyl-L-alanine--D-glutamate ligase [Thermodesulfobacteriota bacterium]|nr:UDP-N-acetylmuramoyl-L-alanine--D-glutamate ligase [Thermodesulfobacteriota bacterium]
MTLNFENKKVVVLGLANTGLSVVRFLRKQGARVVAADIMSQEDLGHYAEKALAMGAGLDLGPHKAETFSACDLIVVSPGVPHTIEPLKTARAKGVPVVGELELAARHIHEPIVAITGTNGKTTTTSLVGEMLRASGLDVFVGGNIGQPLIDYVDKGLRTNTIVAEVSSFQLDTMESFRPKVAVLLNITEDHLDRYSDFQGYVRSKGRIFENQETTDVAILNQADPWTGELEKKVPARKLYFNIPARTSSTGPPRGGRGHGAGESPHGAQIRGDEIMCSLPGHPAVVLSLAKFRLAGVHNVENAAAASLAALSSGASVSGIQKALDRFKGLEHRLQYVKTINGVAYYDDSKATNVDAVVRALESFDAPVILIMGGRDKGGSYAGLGERVKTRVKKLIAFGESKKSILAVLAGLTDSQGATSLDEAVHLAEKTGSAGDVVLLSPGGSSFDMFANYAERGEAFQRAVQSL